MELAQAAAQWRTEGFVILPGFLAGDDLDVAAADLLSIYPTGAQFADHASAARFAAYRGDEFAGIRAFPFSSPRLCRLVVDERLIALAAALFGTNELRVYSAELWAKFTGAADYEQHHHRDYLNHTPLVPSTDLAYRGLEMFIWLSDVTDDLGPTKVVPLSAARGAPAMPHGYLRSERPDLYAAEVSAAGPSGTVLAYSTDTFHRGAQLTQAAGARFSAHVSYRTEANHWTSRHAWGDRSFDPNWNRFVEGGTPEQLALFGFPRPGHPFWTPHTLTGMALRYPDLDLKPWAARQASGTGTSADR